MKYIIYNVIHGFACALHWGRSSKHFSYSAARHCVWCFRPSGEHWPEEVEWPGITLKDGPYVFSHILACWDDSLSLWLYSYLITFCWCWVPFIVGVLCKVLLLFCKICVFSSFVIMALQKRELVESWLLYFYCVLNVISPSLFFDSYSRYYGLIWSVWLWHFLLILTYFLTYPK